MSLLSALIFSRKSVGSRGPLAAAQVFVRDSERCRRRGEERRREIKRRGLKTQETKFLQGKRKGEEFESEQMTGKDVV